MAGKSDYLENALLNGVLGGPAFSLPANVYVALFTATPNDAGGGTEVTGGSYARVAQVNNTTNWPSAAAGSKSNGTVVTFPQATVSWGVVTHFALFDASTGGNMLYFGALSASKTIDISDTPTFPVGTLTITED